MPSTSLVQTGFCFFIKQETKGKEKEERKREGMERGKEEEERKERRTFVTYYAFHSKNW